MPKQWEESDLEESNILSKMHFFNDNSLTIVFAYLLPGTAKAVIDYEIHSTDAVIGGTVGYIEIDNTFVFCDKDKECWQGWPSWKDFIEKVKQILPIAYIMKS